MSSSSKFHYLLNGNYRAIHFQPTHPPPYFTPDGCPLSPPSPEAWVESEVPHPAPSFHLIPRPPRAVRAHRTV